MKKPIIEFKNVTKVFEDSGTVVLKDINFELEEGKFYTLLGASGSGKSTILNIIAGLLDATTGDVYLDGERINDVPTNKRDVHTVFQSYALFPHMTVFENVVVSMEQFNFRYAEPDDFEATPSFASIDVSFISLDLILPALHRILAENGQVVALVKPQFEAGREQIGKNGIIKDSKIHLAVLEKVAAFAGTHGFAVKGVDYSPIQGGHGNIEFLMYLEKKEEKTKPSTEQLEAVVELAHKEFKHEE